MSHLVMLGDSIFDNGSYVAVGRPKVSDQMRGALPPAWKLEFLAQDGAKLSHVHTQIYKASPSATHIVASMGGNDVLSYAQVMLQKSERVAHSLYMMSLIQQKFKRKYRGVVTRLLDTNADITLCTIYNPCEPLEQAALQSAENVGVSVFNDVIFQIASEFGIRVVDLRNIFTQRRDYANVIEPSHVGGQKMVRALLAQIIGETNDSHITKSRRA